MNVIGLSLPNINKPYVHGGVVQAVVLWNTRDLGYLTVLAAAKLAHGGASRPARRQSMPGRLGRLEVRGSEIILGAPLLMNKANIDQLRFLVGTGRARGGGDRPIRHSDIFVEQMDREDVLVWRDRERPIPRVNGEAMSHYLSHAVATALVDPGRIVSSIAILWCFGPHFSASTSSRPRWSVIRAGRPSDISAARLSSFLDGVSHVIPGDSFGFASIYDHVRLFRICGAADGRRASRGSTTARGG